MNNIAFQTVDPFEPIEKSLVYKGLSVTYDRNFNLGNYERVNPAITIWTKRQLPEYKPLDLHHAKERLRRMARENVRAQWHHILQKDEVIFLGLQPPFDGSEDQIRIETVRLSLIYKANLGDQQAITSGYTDWADLRHLSHSPSQLHMALSRMWLSLWANIEDELCRARGVSSPVTNFGLPTLKAAYQTAV